MKWEGKNTSSGTVITETQMEQIKRKNKISCSRTMCILLIKRKGKT